MLHTQEKTVKPPFLTSSTFYYDELKLKILHYAFWSCLHDQSLVWDIFAPRWKTAIAEVKCNKIIQIFPLCLVHICKRNTIHNSFPNLTDEDTFLSVAVSSMCVSDVPSGYYCTQLTYNDQLKQMS